MTTSQSHPRDHRVFPGRLDPRHPRLAERATLLAFPGMRGDFRDWADVEQWADSIAADLTAAAAAEAQSDFLDLTGRQQ